ncbi:MAG: hypothetical protein ACHQPH_01290 [Reyranellales bacterium]|jgi:hypothetical protein
MGNGLRASHFFLWAMVLAGGTVPTLAAAEDIDTWTPVVEHRKDVVVARLGVCESGTSAHPDRSGYLGPFQFATRTVISYVRERDGRTLTVAEAQALARNDAQAAELAKYVIFERNGQHNWPACSRKLGLAHQVKAIRVP